MTLSRTTLPEERPEERGPLTRTLPEERPEERGPRHEGRPHREPARIIDVPPSRYEECLQVLHAGFGTEVDDYGLTAENTPTNPAFWDASVIPALVGRGFQLFAVEDAARIVGCAFIGPSRGHPGSWVLRHLAVAPDARSRGHGEALVSEAVRRARTGGGTGVRIGIVAENQRLSRWYRRLGFTTTEAGIRYPGLVFTVDHLELQV